MSSASSILAQVLLEDDESVAEIVRDNFGLVSKMAGIFSNATKGKLNIDPDDLTSAGYDALLKGARAYDKKADKNEIDTPLVQYLTKVIRNDFKKLFIKRKKESSIKTELDAPIGHEDDSLTGVDLLKGPEDDPTTSALKVETSSLLDEIIMKVVKGKRAREILQGYREGKTHQQMADELGTSKENVWQIFDRATKKIFHEIDSRGLGSEDFLNKQALGTLECMLQKPGGLSEASIRHLFTRLEEILL